MRVLTTIDFWSGLAFAAIGFSACATALGFDSRSSTYPATLAAALGLLGLALVVKAWRNAAAQTASAEGCRVILEGPALEIGVWILWALALWAGLGYVGPTFAACLALILRHVEDRRPRLHVAQAAGVALGVFAIFYLIFNVPLPELDVVRDLLD